MTKKSSWRPALGKTLILSALLTVTLPGIAFANTMSVTVRTPGATSGPGSTFSEISTHADCAAGELLSSPGINQAIGTGTTSNGNHVNGISPSSNGSSEYLGTTGVVGHDVRYALGIGGSGGAVNGSFSTTPYAMCFDSSVINHTQVIMNKASGPSGTTPLVVMATCPANTRLLGGGARTTPASVGSLKPLASYPSYSSGYSSGNKAAGNGAINPDSWVAVAGNGGGGGSNNQTFAYAICTETDNVSGVTVTVRFSEVSGPTTATTGQTTTVGCQEGDGTLTGGGAGITGGGITSSTTFPAPGSNGDHLNGSYPSNSSGNPVSNGTTNANHWTAFTHTGGSSSPSTYTDVWAICVDDQ